MSKTSMTILPRFIRHRDAPRYLGMDRNRFDSEIRPYLTVVRIGKQGIAFCRLELDEIAEQYLQRNGCPGRLHGEKPWDTKQRPVSSAKRTGSGTSTNGSAGAEFAKALVRLKS